MYQTPTLQDFQRKLDSLMNEAQHEARSERSRLTNEYAARGLASSGALISSSATTMDQIHKRSVERASELAHEFVQFAGLTPKELGVTVKQRLDNLGGFVLSQVPSAKLDAFHLQQFRQKYSAVFQQRVEGAIRDIEIGIIGVKSVVIKDVDMQDVILKKFYDQRHQRSFVAMPENDAVPIAERIRIANVCDQLRQRGFLEWKVPVVGEPQGMGRILEKGIAYIERGPAIPTNNVAPKRELAKPFKILLSSEYIKDDIAEATGALGVASLYMDLDDFKQLNTKFSESVVDRDILPQFMTLLQKAVGQLGFAYHEHGDELVVVLPNANLTISKEFAEAFRDMLSKEVFLVNGTDEVRLKTSIGIAHVANGLDRANLKENANLAMRKAKDTGKDKVCVFEMSAGNDLEQRN